MSGVFGTPKGSKNLEIILDSPFAVFYGDSHEAEPVAVTGTLVLNNSDHMNVRGVKIKIQGKWKVGWTSYAPLNGNPNSTQLVRDKGELLNQEKQFIPASTSVGLPSTTHRIAPGRHEWRFEFMLDPKLPESVEGLAGNHVIYNLSAEIDRGYMSKSLVATKHLRVIRTLSSDMSETVPFPYSNEDTWADKIKYHIYIPSRYYAFGTSIPVQFTLIPLRKGVKIGKIKMEVIERVTLQTNKAGDSPQTTTMADKTVAKMDQPCPQESSRRLVEESSGLADESYHFEAVLPLQRSLKSCRQSVSTDSIKVFHNLKIYVNIHNPDGHVSQLCLRNLVHLYISPHMRINDEHVMTPSQTLTDPILGLDHPTPEAPPTYGTHLMDQLYDDIDISGFNSGMATPANYLSRQPSLENLASRLAAVFPASGNASQDVSPDSSRSSSITDSAAVMLRTRLNALSGQESVTASTSRNNSLIPGVGQTRYELPSATTAGQLSGQNTPPHTRTQLDLSRVPSYNTALRTPYASRSPNLDGLPEVELPTYDYAVGLTTPNSPQQSPFPPTPPADTETAGYPFTRRTSPPADKYLDPERRSSNPPVPPLTSRLSGFWSGIGRRRGSQ